MTSTKRKQQHQSPMTWFIVLAALAAVLILELG